MTTKKESEREPSVFSPRFPLFVDLSGKKVLLVGGGAVALRRAQVLLPFGPRLTVIDPAPNADLQRLGATVIRRPYEGGDCAGFSFVLAATDSRKVNHDVFLEASSRGIPVNAADCPDECDFYFPGIVRRGSVVIGVTASGSDHGFAKTVTENIRREAPRLIPKKEEQNEP